MLVCIYQLRESIKWDVGKEGNGIRLISLVEEWSCNISGTISEEQYCVGDNFLGMSYMPPALAVIDPGSERREGRTGSISNLHTKHQHKRRIIRSRQIITNQPSNFPVEGDKS